MKTADGCWCRKSCASRGFQVFHGTEIWHGCGARVMAAGSADITGVRGNGAAGRGTGNAKITTAAALRRADPPSAPAAASAPTAMQPDRTALLARLLARAHPGPRRRDGHDDPDVQARRGRLPRRRRAHAPCLAASHDLKGDNDLLVLTQPDVVRAIHDAYLEAGADIIETNTFNATSIALADYGSRAASREINAAAARGSRASAPTRGPRGRRTGRASSPARSARPTAPRRSRRTSTIRARATSRFDELVAAYGEAVDGLIEGGVDLLLVETMFDTLNAKAALFAIETLFERARAAPAGDRVGDDHRRLGPHAVGTDGRGVLELGPARAAARRRPQLRARRGADAAVRRGAARGSPTPASRAIRTPACPTSSAATTRRRRRPRRCSASSRARASSTSSAAAAARRPAHIRGDRRGGRRGVAAAQRASAERRRAVARACPASEPALVGLEPLT